MGRIIRNTGLFFADSSYVPGLLDSVAEELLVTDFMRFDCVLHVEAVVALARGIAIENCRFSGFEERLKSMRYRRGSRNGYCSRLRYFWEWIRENARQDINQKDHSRLSRLWIKSKKFTSTLLNADFSKLD